MGDRHERLPGLCRHRNPTWATTSLTVDVILVAPGMSVTYICKGRLIAAGIDNEHVTNFMVGASSDPNPCHYFPGSTRYITNARRKSHTARLLTPPVV